jgi:hypothetical protein
MTYDPSLELDELRARVAELEAERDRWRGVTCRFLDACVGTYNPELAEQAAEMFDELKAALAVQEEEK